MSKIRVIGVRNTEFDMDSNHYTGRNIYFVNDDYIVDQGYTTGRMFLNDNRFKSVSFNVPCVFDVTYNRWGKPEHIEVYPDEQK